MELKDSYVILSVFTIYIFVGFFGSKFTETGDLLQSLLNLSIESGGFLATAKAFGGFILGMISYPALITVGSYPIFVKLIVLIISIPTYVIGGIVALDLGKVVGNIIPF